MKFIWGTAFGAAVVAWAAVSAGGRPAFEFGAGVVAGALASLFLISASVSRHGHGSQVAAGAGSPAEQSTNKGRIPPSIAGSGRSQRKPGRLQSRRAVLSSVQQEVVSALVNQGARFAEAEAAVFAAAAGGAGQSFDQLFRLAIAILNAPRRGVRKAS